MDVGAILDRAAFGTGDPALDPPEVRAKLQERLRVVPQENPDAENPAEPTGRPGSGYTPRLYSSAEFFSAQFPREFLVRGVLADGQAGVMGGPKKALKSGISIDLAVSLDTATPFLGFDRFAVPRRINVLLLNGESGNATIQETGARIARARGIDPCTLGITWGADLPQLANAEHLQDLADIITARGIKVVMVDPAYLCLMTGTRAEGAQAGNLFDMGAIYSQFARFMIEAGATPILTAHAKKGRGFDPLDLDDLTYAGIAEFARQWILISRREAYEGDGAHRLWLNVGGSAGHSFLGHLDVEEGIVGEHFEGRVWNVAVEGFQEAKREQKAGRDQAKAEERQADESHVMRIIDGLSGAGESATLSRVRNGSELSRSRTDSALERLRQQRLIEQYTATVTKGKNATQDAAAYRRKGSACYSV